MRRGIEKESLRARPDGALATTPHSSALGSPLTHPNITTDFSESQLELITGARASVEALLEELTHIHQVVYRRDRRRNPLVREHAVQPAAGRRDPDRALRKLQRRAREDRVPHGPRASLRPAHADHLGHPLQLVAARRARTRSTSRWCAISGATRGCCSTSSALRRRCARASSPAIRSTACSASRPARCTCPMPPRCAWGASATRATRRPRSR